VIGGSASHKEPGYGARATLDASPASRIARSKRVSQGNQQNFRMAEPATEGGQGSP
jgi:hypothetical protein